jgi:hypothetical protein
LAVNILTIAAFVVSGILPTVINNTDPVKLDVYPYYLLVYVHQLIIAQCCLIIAIIIFYSKRPKLQNFHKRQCEEVINDVKNWFGF